MNNHIINIDKNKSIGCQLCIKDCPARNIELKGNQANVIDDKCIHCMACIHRCPKQVIKYGKHTTGKHRYVFPSEDIIDIQE